jgi:TRAP-type transport system periplasmic protein
MDSIANPSASRRRFAIASTAALASVGFSIPARAAQFEFKCSSDLPIDHPSTPRLVEMWAAIEKESGGRIHTQFFPANQLGGPESMQQQLRLGAVTFNYVAPGNMSSIIPAADICYLGFAYKDTAEALHVMDGPVGAYLLDAAASSGLHALRTFWNSAMYQISSSSHPIRTPDDLRGFKIRVAPSKISVDLFKALGAVSTPLGANEIYTALQTKLVDGTATSMVTIEASKFYEVQKYVSITNHAWNGQWVIANGEAWKSLGPELQALVERNNTKYGMLERVDADKLSASVADKLRSQGMTLNQVDVAPFRPLLRGYFQYWADAFGSKPWGMLEASLGRKLG